MPKGTICLELLGSPHSNPLNFNSITWTYFNIASVLFPSERHERRVGATLNSVFKILIHVVVHMFYCFLVHHLYIKLVIFMLEWLVFSRSVMHFCWPVSFRWSYLCTFSWKYCEDDVYFLVYFDFMDCRPWFHGWEASKHSCHSYPVRIKPKLVYTLTHSSFQNISLMKYIALLPTIPLIAATRPINCKCIGREAIASCLL